eukprot:gene12973-7631_t
MGNTQLLKSVDRFSLGFIENSSQSAQEAVEYSKSKINPELKRQWDTELLKLSRNTSVFIKSKQRSSKYEIPEITKSNIFQNSFIHDFICYRKNSSVVILNLNFFEMKKFDFLELEFKQCCLSFDEKYLILYTPNVSKFFIFEFLSNENNMQKIQLKLEQKYIPNVSRIIGLNNSFYIISSDGIIYQFNIESTEISKLFSVPHFVQDEIFNTSYNQDILYLKNGIFSFYFANLFTNTLYDHKLSGTTEISNNQQFILNAQFSDFTLFNYNLDEIIFQQSIPYEILFSIFDYHSHFILVVIKDFILCYSIELKKLIFCILTQTTDIKSIFMEKFLNLK